ncbi:choice-of-anchor E domain-containing protein [Dyadobacter sp. CY356]|uniref:choice-of-anchor E domain-containing protein n=1 Tax=Dyadobacter sp. CY356 TaxID=2906442 RepID=UPI001F190011|nr:choice-of-anchor E domain-containing protein [Dyadobacter sp. CY356]MCF0055070.1 choice-of-anchor E domain-containing protein [Dyadobacter sp. CY356]
MIGRTFTISALLVALSQLTSAQAPDLTSTVSGVIWQDEKPVNGLRASSEKKLAGILVKLLDAQSQLVVATALSDATGQYSLKANAGTYQIEFVYPAEGFSPAPLRAGSDPLINSSAGDDNFTDVFSVGNNEAISNFGLGLVAQENTITYCTNKATLVTEWSDVLTLPKSTVTPVPLNVRIFAAESVFHPTIGIENTATANGYTITAAGKVTMTLPVGSSLTMTSDVTLNGQLGNFDGVRDYDGISGDSFFNQASFSTNTRSVTNATQITNNFVGPQNATFSIPTVAQSSVAVIGSGNLETFVQTYVSAGACVVYTYASGALPVTLTSFTAVNDENVSRLEWSTTSETNSDRFEIQRSGSGKTWEKIGTINALKQSSTLAQYSFKDNAPLTGQNLYRLKMIDQDETFAYSRIVSLNFKSSSSLVIYPNPVSDKVFIDSPDRQAISAIDVFDQNGRQKAQGLPAKKYVDVRSLDNGTYFVRIVYSSGLAESKKILINH